MYHSARQIKKILAIGAHPDDIEIGCGGTLLHLKKQYGAAIHTLLMTCGEAATYPEQDREEEQDRAFRILGVEKRFFAGLADTQIEMRSALLFIEKVVDDVVPDYIFTHYKEDTHQDHRVVAEATLAACRNRSGLLFYESISTENFQPTLFVDVAETLAQKCEAVAAHTSQDARLGLVPYIQTLAAFRAYRTGTKAVEGFIPRKFLWR